MPYPIINLFLHNGVWLCKRNLADKYGLDLEQFKTSTNMHEQMKMIEPFLTKD